ncbi:hypothetical protein H2199_005550, partial [Coniosporium tulheliwenetii]
MDRLWSHAQDLPGHLQRLAAEGADEGSRLLEQGSTNLKQTFDEGTRVVQEGLKQTFDEGARIIQENLKQTFDEGARTVQQGVQESLKQAFNECLTEARRKIKEENVPAAVSRTVQQGVHEGLKQAFEECLTQACRDIQEKDVRVDVFRNFLECYRKAEGSSRAVAWWGAFLPLVTTVAIFGGSITFTLIIQEIANPARLNPDDE